ncbi:MAG: S9 family peptidase [Chitinophagaceae bacterium]|nr:S9 family peptidase [Chitinophagaceae bacterium]
MRKILAFTLLCGIALQGYAQPAKKDITLEDIWKNGTFRIKSVPGFNAMEDGKRYTQLDNENGKQSISTYNLATGKKEKTLFDNTVHTDGGTKLSVSDYSFSKNEKKILLLCEAQNIYRRSVLYRTYVFDTRSGNITPIGKGKVLHASFNEEGSMVAYVADNNLYYQDLASGTIKQVTSDGERNKIINGNCDWVYEEEFEFTRAYQWSPKGNYIAYYRFDESKVPQYTMTIYDSLYPTPYQYKYPKAGEPNSVVSIKIFDLKNNKTEEANVGAEQDQYIPRIKWTETDNVLCIFRMNRLQNKLELLLANATTGFSEVIYAEQNAAYIEINDNLEFLPDNASFIFNSEQSGYNQLYRWNWKEQKLNRLTEGSFDIESITGIDKTKKLVYYTAAETSPLERKLYAVDWEGNNKICLTGEAGTHAITPCQGFRFFLDKHSSLNSVPVFYLRDAKGKIVRTLEDNSALKAKMQEYNFGTIRATTVKGSSEQLNAWMILPPGFDSSKKYPVLMYQYSGPGSQMVADKFPVGDYFWHQMLASKGYIVFCADGTGTGLRGEAFKKKTYLQLGKLESEDQIAAAKNLGSLSYVDPARIGIWGWSFGGFMSSTCMLKGGDLFKAGIAVAPVTNWRYYDNIYTERYMRTPAENAKGYDGNAPEKMAEGLKGKFFLVHGTGDDNVHFQNSVMLAEQLIQKNKAFEDAYYPNKNHGIGGGNSRLHLYTRMTDFILKNL